MIIFKHIKPDKQLTQEEINKLSEYDLKSNLLTALGDSEEAYADPANGKVYKEDSESENLVLKEWNPLKYMEDWRDCEEAIQDCLGFIDPRFSHDGGKIKAKFIYDTVDYVLADTRLCWLLLKIVIVVRSGTLHGDCSD